MYVFYLNVFSLSMSLVPLKIYVIFTGECFSLIENLAFNFRASGMKNHCRRCHFGAITEML